MKTLWAISLTAAALAGALLYGLTAGNKPPNPNAGVSATPGLFPGVEAHPLPTQHSDDAVRRASWSTVPALLSAASSAQLTGKVYVDKAGDTKADLSKLSPLTGGQNRVDISTQPLKVLVVGLKKDDQVEVAAQDPYGKSLTPTSKVGVTEKEEQTGKLLDFPSASEFAPDTVYKLIPKVTRGGQLLASEILEREVILVRGKSTVALSKPTVLEGTTVWKEYTEPIRLRGTTVTVRFTAAPKDHRVYCRIKGAETRKGDDAKSLPVPSDGTVEFQFANLPAQSLYTVDAFAYTDPTETARVSVQLATPATDLGAPSITEFAVGKYAAYQKVNGTVNVHESLVRLKGRGARPGAKLRFVIEDKGSTPGFRESSTEAVGKEGGDWQADVALPADLGRGSNVNHFLHARQEQDGKHIYHRDDEKITFQVKSVAIAEADKPTISELRIAGDSAKITRASAEVPHRSNATQYDVVVTVPTNYTETQVLLFDLNGADPNAVIGSFPLSADASKGTVVRTAALSDGRHSLVAALARGSKVEQRSEPLELIVRAKGLKVDGVVPPNFGTAAGVQTLTIRFNPENPLVPERAKKRENYVLRASGGTGAFDRGTEQDLITRTGGSYLLDGPDYNLDTNSVTLRFKDLPPDIYRLEVRGLSSATADMGIRDVFGNLLEGVEGKPGTDFRIVLGKPIDPTATEDGAALPSVKRGITGQSGPYIEYKEFTRPRERPNGFNPSDHVETRVARLYYYRDAHRVAQIINRDVKSWNRAAVEVRRRMADKARDEANAVTDERRAQERTAERLAKEARAVEHELAKAQRDLEDARQQSSRAAQEVTQLRQAVGELQVNRPSVQDEQRRLVEEANTRMENLRTQRTQQEEIVKTRQATLDQLRKLKADVLQKVFDIEQEKERIRQSTAPDKEKQLESKAKERLPHDELYARYLFQEEQAAGEQRAARDRISEIERELTESRNRLAGTESSTRAVDYWKLRLDEAVKTAATSAEKQKTLEGQIRDLQGTLQTKRAAELQANEKASQVTAKEDRAREEQFRREVAAAHEDPDTYAPGKPDSDDPVRQVSVSVIGEGLIQLRGPIKGINIIREMINQIDAPVGQVRVAVHTVQLNGEHGDRMEKISACIQRYIDHSRFLTMQSAQMLRHAIIQVASQKAEMAFQESPFDSQEARDQRYLHAFFGKDFINELRVLDSEFLRSGNKLLSLHSMDTTSLASALFIFALAKNTTRIEILEKFQQMMCSDLPAAEHTYFQAGGKKDHCCKFQFLSRNARFQSLLGFFNAELNGAETLNPVQREFIRLAQIFKSRLITEMELKQRVMERAVIEERLGDYLKELEEARKKDKESQAILASAEQSMNNQRSIILQTFSVIDARMNQLRTDENRITGGLADALQSAVLDQRRKYMTAGPVPLELPKQGQSRTEYFRQKVQEGVYLSFDAIKSESASTVADSAATAQTIRKIAPSDPGILTLKFSDAIEIHFRIVDGDTLQFATAVDRENWNSLILRLREIQEHFNMFVFEQDDTLKLAQVTAKVAQIAQPPERFGPGYLADVHEILSLLQGMTERILNKMQQIESIIKEVVGRIGKTDVDAKGIYSGWLSARDLILDAVRGKLREEALKLTEEVEQGFRKLLEQNLKFRFAQQEADRARRPIDHKKLLDMLIDEYHDKYVELLEGTRAHTANIDNYIKSLATALDDDFNTQFYNPTFREIRTAAARFWDVSLGKIESTSVLTNNRSFGKVSPEATMEFDLPRRDILITEAAKGAKALMQEHGALLQDPTFLSLMKLRSGQPTASQAQGANGGLSAVRNVLPGLPSGTEERVLSQDGPGRREFGAALEALIPDPAIYKFETGTGYEIRPVIAPDGQAVVFHFNYMYTTNIREPVRADEKHLGRVKRHFIDTDVQLSNYELREVSRYIVGLKASRTSRGVPLLEDIPGVGLLFRPLPQSESSLQQNLIYAQSTIFPTLFDLMGLRWAPAVADLDPLRTSSEEFVVRNRRRDLMNRVFDYSSRRVDEFLRIPEAERRSDFYRSQETLPHVHPNGYSGPGLNLRDSHLQEGYRATDHFPPSRLVPGQDKEGMLVPPPGSTVPPGRTIITPGGSMPHQDGGILHDSHGYQRNSPGSSPAAYPPALVPTQTTRPGAPPPAPVVPRQGARLSTPEPSPSRVIQAGHNTPAPPPQPPPQSKRSSIMRFFGKSDK